MAAASESVVDHQVSIEDISGLVDGLRSSFESGRTRPLAWRKAQLERLVDLLRENSEELVRALQADLGKPEMEAVMADIVGVVQEAKGAIKKLPKWTKPRRIKTPLQSQPARSRQVPDPLGVVLIISPWNYPVQLLLSPLVGAIAAGNCAVLKPSEMTPHTSAAMASLVARYLDGDCIRVVEGAVPETSELLAQRFDHIMYTGNGQVGRIVMEAAAKHLTPVTLELGGKSPCLVDASANLDVAARRIAWGKFLNAGQTCIAPDYLLVEESVEAPLLEKLASCIADFYGPDPQATPDFGRIVNVRHHRRLAGLLKDAGEVYLGGELDEDDRYISPTILRGVDPESDIMQEEIFGPILPVLTVPDMGEAIRFVNGRDKPLALYLFSSRPEVEEQVVHGTSSGGICVNATIWHIANPNLPFGGVGPSGMGAYHGKASFDTFSHQKALLAKSTKVDPKIMYPPYTETKTRLVKKML
jgi:aldehyde dehydrogenase (NAD+)